MIKIYQKTALMRAVQFDGTEDAEEIIAFISAHRGVLTNEQGELIGRRSAGIIFRDNNSFADFVTKGITTEEFDAHEVLFQDPEVKAVIWNDLHRYWNPLRLTDHVALDSQGCFYPIANADVIGSYTEVGQK